MQRSLRDQRVRATIPLFVLFRVPRRYIMLESFLDARISLVNVYFRIWVRSILN